jgi:5-methylcytosine-specific restriction endonuclease McrA
MRLLPASDGFLPVNGSTFVAERGTIKHRVPLAMGGTHTWDNVVLCCWQCNVRKNRRSADEWLASLRALQISPGGARTGPLSLGY